MPIVFGAREAYDPGLAAAYGKYQQQVANAQHQPHGGGDYGGGGGGQQGGGYEHGDYTLEDQNQDLVKMRLQSQHQAGALDQQSEALNQAEEIRMNRLQMGISSVQEAVDNGSVSQEDGQGLIMEMKSGLSPLEMRKQKSQLAMQEQQTQMLQNTLAQHQSMQEQDAAFRAKNLPQRIQQITNPSDPTETLHMFEARPGHWEPLPFGDANPTRARAREGRDTTELTAAERSKAYLEITKRIAADPLIKPEDRPAAIQRELAAHDRHTNPHANAEVNAVPPATREEAQTVYLPFNPETPREQMKPYQVQAMQAMDTLAQQATQAIPTNVEGISTQQRQQGQDLQAKIQKLRSMAAAQGSRLGMEDKDKKEYDALFQEIRRAIARGTRGIQTREQEQRAIEARSWEYSGNPY